MGGWNILGKERPGARVLMRDSVECQECHKSSGYMAGEQHSALHFPLLTSSRGNQYRAQRMRQWVKRSAPRQVPEVLAWGCSPLCSGEPASTQGQP